MRNLEDYSAILLQAEARRSFLKKKISETIEKKKSSLQLLESVEKAQALIQQVAKETQESLKFHLEDIVQLAIDAVFPGEYDFKVNFEIKRGKTEAQLTFLRNGVSIDPQDSSGGGVSDVCSFALRLAVWSLGRTRKFIVLDEPFRLLSRDLRPKASEMLKKLSKRLKLQVVIVSHEENLVEIADKLFSVKLREGRDGYKKSHVVVLKGEESRERKYRSDDAGVQEMQEADPTPSLEGSEK